MPKVEITPEQLAAYRELVEAVGKYLKSVVPSSILRVALAKVEKAGK